MIFATVGSALPFDRFTRAIDGWAARNPEVPVFIQVGAGSYVPKAPHARMLKPSEFGQRVKDARLIIAHAGMGSVIMAAEAEKPIVLFPRRFALGEHTTDHQLDTIGWLKDRTGIYIAMDETELDSVVERAFAEKKASETMGATAPPAFLERIRGALTS